MSGKSTYDPVKSLEGMFNGSLVRIAYALKDPATFASSTKDILQETAKKFQDALDDCEIQILDAKWYLEHQLAQNKARRETKAKEELAAQSAKRKHEEMQRAENSATVKSSPEQPSKRQKLEDNTNQKMAQIESRVEVKPQTPVKSESNPPGRELEKTQSSDKSTPKRADTKSPVQTQKQQSVTAVPEPIQKPVSRPPDTTKASYQNEISFDDNFDIKEGEDENSAAKDDFNFTSMFGDATGDGGMGDGELGFDLDDLEDPFSDPPDAGDAGDQNNTSTIDNLNNDNNNDDDLSSLLPGLESYANQANDDTNNFGMSLADNTGGLDNTTATTGAELNNANNPFDPANMGTNDFDDFFNSSLGDIGGFNHAGNLGGNNDDNTMNLDNFEDMDAMDFDSMFN